MTASFFQNVPYAVRNLVREPLLVISATVTFAVCIGANTTVFSIGNSILVRPLPYPGSERIDWISERSGPNHEDIGALPDYYRLREGSRAFEEVAALNPVNVNWTGVQRPEQLDAAQVSASFFRVMGMRPSMGRYLAAEEEGSKAPSVVVLSYDFWRSRLGSDFHVIGETMTIDRLPRTIIGVMPQGFDFPRYASLDALAARRIVSKGDRCQSADIHGLDRGPPESWRVDKRSEIGTESAVLSHSSRI